MSESDRLQRKLDNLKSQRSIVNDAISDVQDDLDTARAEELAKAGLSWPRRVKAYLHSSKESTWEYGAELGLSDEAIRGNFLYALSEVEIELEVEENGDYKIVAIDGIPVNI
jgi:hypothetical protein